MPLKGYFIYVGTLIYLYFSALDIPINSKALLSVLGLISAGLAANSLFTPALANDYTAEDLLSLRDPAQVKVTICHIPPGQPENRHEITVGEPAVAAHIAEHGDYIGPCVPNPIW